ncbi:MAG: amidohydrolase, partial [Acidobacteria bacterium]
MKTGTIRRRAGLVCFAIGAAALSGILFHAQVYAQEAPKHTVFYTHGRIYTNDPAEPWAEAMAVADGKIVCIGKMAHVLLDCGGSQQSAETVHLNEHFVMPGFNDAHVHLGSAGADALAVELRGVKSPEEMQKRVAEAVAHHKEGEWITGSGWDHTLWPDKRFPNRQQLDAVAPKNPVILTHISGHVAVANSLALKKAEIDKSTPNPPGGEIEHDGLGEPTGMLKEAAAMALVRVRIPDLSGGERRRGLEIVLSNVTRNGVTSVQDNSAWEDFQVYQQLKEDGKLTARITEWL